MCFVSLHADPAYEYPFFSGYADERGVGAGEGTHPQLPAAARNRLGRVRARARRRGRRSSATSAPTRVVVSLGVDTAAEDADTFQLVADDFARIGEAIGALGLPTVFVQEGGYDLGVIGRNVVGVLRGVERRVGARRGRGRHASTRTPPRLRGQAPRYGRQARSERESRRTRVTRLLIK